MTCNVSLRSKPYILKAHANLSNQRSNRTCILQAHACLENCSSVDDIDVRYSSGKMVLLHVKRGEESLFLHSCTLEDNVSEVGDV